MQQEHQRRETAQTVEKSRGRIETRTLTTTTNLVDSGYLDWPGAKQLIRIERQTTAQGKCRSSVGYAITSLPRSKANAETLLSLVRGRWEIENRCFHVLDVTLHEDHDRTRTRNAAHAKSVLGHVVLNLARRLGQTVPFTIREHALKPHLLFQRLGIVKN